MKLKPPVIVGIVVALIIIGIAVFALLNPSIVSGLGLKPSEKTISVAAMSASTTPGRFGGMRVGFVTGSIEVLNGDGFTLALQDGTTKDVNLSATTTIQNYATASSTPTAITADQLSVGEQVSVIGTPDEDGSISARMVRTGAVPVRGNMPSHQQPQ